jgi:DNA recombination protein RmuC
MQTNRLEVAVHSTYNPNMELSTGIIIIIVGFISVIAVLIYFINLKFKQLNNSAEEKNNNEVITKWLESMQVTVDSRLKDVQGTMDHRLKNVQDQLDKTTNTLNYRVDESTKTMNKRLDQAAEVISDVKKELGSMNEIGRSMKDLQSFLKSPKLRGNIGEQVLRELLMEMLPSDNYILQYTFKTGDRVDALLKVDEGYIPVDSKFPMDNFKNMMEAEKLEERESIKKLFLRDVKKHIDDISKKYILPAEGTVDFALMYIPSEAVYYEIVVNISEMGQYAWGKESYLYLPMFSIHT